MFTITLRHRSPIICASAVPENIYTRQSSCMFRFFLHGLLEIAPFSVLLNNTLNVFSLGTCYAPIIVMPHLPQVGHGWGLLGICKSRLTISPPLGTILCCKSPTFCIRISKTMKIYGQMPQPWGQIMLTNRYKSPPVARPGVGGG